MKEMKSLKWFMALVPIIICGCAQVVHDLKETEDISSVSFSISSFKLADEYSDTKTSFGSEGGFLWTDKDTVGIYPNTGGQVYFSLEGGGGANRAEFDGGGWAFKPASTYYSYYPFVGNIYLDRTKIPVSYLGQKQIGTTATDHIGPFDFMYTAGTNAAGGSIDFQYDHLNCIIEFRLTLPADSYSKLTITAPTAVFPITGYYDLTADHPVIVPTEYSDHLSIDLENITVGEQEMFKVYLLSAPVNLNGVGVTVSVLNTERTEMRCNKTPTREYLASTLYYLTCNQWSSVPQTMAMSIEKWGESEDVTGNAQ